MLIQTLLVLLSSICLAVAQTRTVVDRETATWNMQGGLSGQYSKWDQVRRMMRREVEVLAIQEGGSPDSIPSISTLIDVNVVNPDGVDVPFSAYRWNSGSDSRPEIYYLYFLYSNNRCNLAITTRVPADNVILLKRHRSFYDEERPILGVRLGNDYFFNIHAVTGGGNNAPGLVNRTYSFMQEVGSNSWMLMGDFNRNSSSLMDSIRDDYNAIVDEVATVSQNLKTHINGGNLDYAVDPVAISAGHQAQRFDDATRQDSDHYPVKFIQRPRQRLLIIDKPTFGYGYGFG